MTHRLRILVTGASGFVGGAYARHLRALGHAVVGTVSSRKGSPEDVAVDVRRRESFEAIPAGRFDIVVHAAALIGQKHYDRATREVNIGGTVNALDFARSRGAVHFVQVSSIAVYGFRCLGEDRGEATPLSTGRFLPFETEYQRSKAEAERVVERSGMPFTTLRLPLVLGAGSSFAAPMILAMLESGKAPYAGRNDRRVSVACAGNLGPMLESAIERGPAGLAYNACDHHLPWKELVGMYAAGLGTEVPWLRRPRMDILFRAHDPIWVYWIANSLLGAHFPSARLEAERPFRRVQSVEEAVREDVASARPARA